MSVVIDFEWSSYSVKVGDIQKECSQGVQELG
jgi:hypothetical protein